MPRTRGHARSHAKTKSEFILSPVLGFCWASVVGSLVSVVGALPRWGDSAGTLGWQRWGGSVGKRITLKGMVTVSLLTRSTCGSCARVADQIRPIVAEMGAELEILDVDSDAEMAAEFGDRVPVVLVDEEEIACWEVDDDELIDAIEEAQAG